MKASLTEPFAEANGDLGLSRARKTRKNCERSGGEACQQRKHKFVMGSSKRYVGLSESRSESGDSSAEVRPNIERCFRLVQSEEC